MINFRKSLLSAFVSCCWFAQAQASTLHTFVYDDLSAWGSIANVAVGDSLTIQFADGTDFNNAATSDIEGFGYNLAAGASEFFLASSFYRPAGNGGDLSQVFSEVAGVVSLTYSNSVVGYIQALQNGLGGQFVPGQNTHVYTQIDGGGTAYLQGLTGTVTYTSSVAAVPLPAGLPLLLVGLGAFGIAGQRKGKTS